jgi:predicted peptidase
MAPVRDLLLLSALTLLCAGVWADPATDRYPYEVHLPQGYAEDAEMLYPLILFLHGGGGLIPADNPIPVYAAGRDDFPFIVVTPIADDRWDVERLLSVLDDVRGRYRVDPDRIFGTGLSSGAVGIWELAASRPATFAAVARVAGRPAPGHACPLRHVPVWLFHNRADEIVPVGDSLRLAEALEACRAPHVHVTIYEELAPGAWHHDAWNSAYHDPDLYAWFMTRARASASGARP